MMLTVERKKIIMDAPDKNHKSKLPQWQSEKMKSLIEERWSEVWEIVVAREHSEQNSSGHSRSLRCNSNF
jgi:hypothetical protein